MSTITATGVAERLRSRIPEAEEQLGRMRAALAVLDPPRTRQPAASRPAAAMSLAQREDAVYAVLRELGVARSSEVAGRLALSSAGALRHLQRLEEAGKITRTGVRAGTRWQVT